MSDETLFSILDRWAHECPDRPALIDAADGTVVRYGELSHSIPRRAAALASNGIGPGTRCVAIMRRNVTFVETVLALSRIGAECLPLDCAAPRQRTLDEARAALSPDFVLFDPERARCLEWRRSGETWIDVTAVKPSGHLRATFETTPLTPLYINASSGSTGVSKMVIATHGQTIANAIACCKALGLEAGRTHLSTFRVHAHDLFVRALVTGGAAVLAPAAEDPVALVSALARFKVNYLMINPLVLAGLMAVVKHGDLQPHLDLVECGGGQLSSVVRRVVGQATGARVISVWGSTETGGVALAPLPGEMVHRHAIGLPIPGYEVMIVDANGAQVVPGGEGEMVIRGEAVADGYIGPEATNDRLRQGTFRTGDVVRCHADGWLELRGRTNNAFKVGGTWVNAERIEAAIREQPGVRDVVVVPHAHRTFGCVPIALVVLERGRPALPDPAMVADRLEDPFLEMPERFIVVDELPTTSAGKIDRAASKRLVTDEPRSERRRRFKPLKTLKLASRALRDMRLLRRLFANPVVSWRLLRLLASERRL